jgi:ERF superfamily
MNLHSENINEISGALAKAQGQLNPAVKDSSNPHFKSKYADLASVWEACRKALSDNGLAVTQIPHYEGDKQFLVTLLTHSSGQWIKSLMALPLQKPGPQELGSCLSYCRRYALASLVGVYQDDDDAERAQNSYRKKEETLKEKTQITDAEWATLDALAQQINDKDYFDKLAAHIQVPTIWDLKPADFDRAMRSIKNKAKEKGIVYEQKTMA